MAIKIEGTAKKLVKIKLNNEIYTSKPLESGKENLAKHDVGFEYAFCFILIFYVYFTLFFFHCTDIGSG